MSAINAVSGVTNNGTLTAQEVRAITEGLRAREIEPTEAVELVDACKGPEVDRKTRKEIETLEKLARTHLKFSRQSGPDGAEPKKVSVQQVIQDQLSAVRKGLKTHGMDPTVARGVLALMEERLENEVTRDNVRYNPLFHLVQSVKALLPIPANGYTVDDVHKALQGGRI